MAKRLFVPVDVHLFDDPAIMEAGPEGVALFVAGLCWCKLQLSDGTIPSVAVEALVRRVGVRPKTVQTLVAAGLWEPTLEGMRVRGWLDWNMSAAEQRAKAAGKADAGRKGAAVRWLREASGDG